MMIPARKLIRRDARDRRHRAPVMALALAAMVTASAASAGAQQIRGRVVDDGTRQAVPGAVVTLFGADSAVLARTEAGKDGFFRLDASAGRWTIGVESVGYAASLRAIEVGSDDITLPAFVMKQEVIALDAVGVEVDSRETTERAVVGFARASHTVTGERLATLEKQGLRFPSAMRDLGAGLRIREWMDPNGAPRLCIESNRRLPTFSNRRGGGTGCDWVALVIDGVVIGAPESTVRTLNLEMFESIEFFTPAEAGNRFGMTASATGALVLWTRGRGPHVSESRNKR